MGSPGSSRHSLVHSLQGSRRRTFTGFRPSPTFRECYVQVTPFGDRLARCPPGGLSTPRESETQSGSTVKRRTPLRARKFRREPGHVVAGTDDKGVGLVVVEPPQERREQPRGDPRV